MVDFKPKKGQVPVNFCTNCRYCTNSYCSVHERPVKKDFNRCFFHSTYQPDIVKVFTVNPNLEQIMKEEEQMMKKRTVSWLEEHNRMVDEMRKNIKKRKEEAE